MNKPKVFVIMPFTEDCFESYEMLKRKFDDEYEFSHAGDEGNQQNILADIIQPIYEADIILADLTGLNPNVMYELGIAHTMCKKTVVITRDNLKDLPFDLKSYRAKDYSTHFVKFDELLSYLDKNFKGAIDGSVRFSNPIMDYLDGKKIDFSSIYAKSEEVVGTIIEEKGFLDFVAEIEDDMKEMTGNVNELTSGLNDMNSGIEKCTKEIDRVNESGGGSGTAAFLRKQSKNAAKYMTDFSTLLKSKSESIFSIWARVESNIHGLLENDIVVMPDNKQSLIEFIKALYASKQKIVTSNENIKGMKEASLKNKGIERSLNKAISFLDDDLATYLDNMDNVCLSIDKIIEKSKFVVGTIDFSDCEDILDT